MSSSSFRNKLIKSFAYRSLLYIYIYIVLFGPVKPELGVIPSGQENHSGAEHGLHQKLKNRMEINL